MALQARWKKRGWLEMCPTEFDGKPGKRSFLCIVYFVTHSKLLDFVRSCFQELGF